MFRAPNEAAWVAARAGKDPDVAFVPRGRPRAADAPRGEVASREIQDQRGWEGADAMQPFLGTAVA
jgi:hypothetical protein